VYARRQLYAMKLLKSSANDRDRDRCIGRHLGTAFQFRIAAGGVGADSTEFKKWKNFRKREEEKRGRNFYWSRSF
jgi:hypothetical protein